MSVYGSIIIIYDNINEFTGGAFLLRLSLCTVFFIVATEGKALETDWDNIADIVLATI